MTYNKEKDFFGREVIYYSYRKLKFTKEDYQKFKVLPQWKQKIVRLLANNQSFIDKFQKQKIIDWKILNSLIN